MGITTEHACYYETWRFCRDRITSPREKSWLVQVEQLRRDRDLLGFELPQRRLLSSEMERNTTTRVMDGRWSVL